jgi:ubiquinone/menaquinone biosynthesis C-methylase UbiE
MFTLVRDWFRNRAVAKAAGRAARLPDYWDQQLTDPEARRQFLDGIGNEHAPARKEVREYVVARGYRSLIDAGCGPAVDYRHFRGQLRYVGMDFADVWRHAAHASRVPFVSGSIDALPFGDSTFDVAYARAVLEHRPYYHDGLRELARVAAKEAIVVFFKLRDDHDLIRPDVENSIHHNNYMRAKVEAFARQLPGVRELEWRHVHGAHSILHLRKATSR